MASIVSAGTTSATALNMSADTSGVLQLASNNGVVALTVDTSQNAGLGVTPNGWTIGKVLQFGNGASILSYSNIAYLNANSYFDGSWRYISTATSGRVEISNNHKWFTAPSGTAGTAITYTQAMTLDGAGDWYLGGTTNTGAIGGRNLYINAPTGGANKITFAVNDASLSYIYANTTELTLGAPSAGSLKFQISGAGTPMTMDANGKLFLGDTSLANDGRFNIIQNSSTNEPMCINDTSGSASQLHMISFQKSGTEVGSIRATNTTTAYITSSDYRLKEEVQPMAGALSKVMLLKPCTYKWKVDGSSSQGFIAHELQEVFSEAVSGVKDGTEIQQYEISPAVPATYDEEGNELTPAIEAVMGEREVPAYQGIDTSFLVATLTAAIQELNAKVTALENK